jgi:hypothetical protein
MKATSLIRSAIPALLLPAAVACAQQAQFANADPAGGAIWFTGQATPGSAEADAPFRWQDPATAAAHGFANAAVGGREGGTALYICRAATSDGIHPGKVVSGKCNIGWNGKELSLDRYELLVNTRPDSAGAYVQRWSAPGAGVVGYAGGTLANAGNAVLRICRGGYNGGIHPGKEWQGKCYIGWGGKEVPLPNYEVFQLGRAPAINAAITKQISPINPADAAHVELGILTAPAHMLRVRSLRTPAGIAYKGVQQSPCSMEPGDKCRQHFDFALDATSSGKCQLNGDYVANFDVVCRPGQAGCSPGTHDVGFSLKSENFCAVKDVDASRYWNQRWNNLSAKDAGMDAQGTLWYLDAAHPVAGGFDVVTIGIGKSAGMRRNAGATRVDGGATMAAIVKSDGSMYSYRNNTWAALPGRGTDIGMGGGDALWCIGNDAQPGGYSIYQWSNGTWANRHGGAVRIDVDGSGNAWVVNDAGQIFHWTGAAWSGVAGPTNVRAIDIGIGANGAVLIAGNDGKAWQWTVGGWRDRGNGGLKFVGITVAGDGMPVGLDETGAVWVANP